MIARGGLTLALVLLALSLPGASNGRVAAQGNGPWTLTCVDCPHRFGTVTDRALRFDAAGQPHVAYGGSQLYYATRAGGSWQIEVADAAVQVGSDAALALDAAGQPHISYYDGQNEDLRYAYRDVSGWHVETLDSHDAVGQFTSIALDSHGSPHISYRNRISGELRYAYREGAVWQFETIDAEPNATWMTSLAIDVRDIPHVAYLVGYPLYDLRYATKTDSGWHIETVDQEGETGWYPSIAVDANGGVHISYEGGEDSDLRYAFKDSSGWHLETIDSDGYAGYATSIALDSDARPHISYLRITFDPAHQTETKYAYRNDSGWHLEIANIGAYSGDFTSLALDGAGNPCIAHAYEAYVQEPALLLLACRQQGAMVSGEQPNAWTVEIIDQEGETGQESSLAIDTLGRPHVAYTSTGLAYAYSAGLPANGAETGGAGSLAPGWQVETVDSQGTTPSLVLDTAGVPHLAYTDATSRALRVAVRGESAWQVETVDVSAGAPSLALDALAQPHIGYASSRGIAYAYRNETGWTIQIVDDRGGSQVSLALDVDDQPRIAYVNAQGDLKHAYRAGGAWYTQFVDVTDAVFAGPSLAFDRENHPHLSYGMQDVGNEPLKHAYQDATGWHVETVQYFGTLGQKTSLVFDREGRATIGFGEIDSILVATADPTGWHVETVAESFPMQFSALVLDPWDRPYLAFHDAHITYGLMLASRGPSLSRVWLPVVSK